MTIFLDKVENGIEIFMDDFSVFGSSFDLSLENLERVFVMCEESNLVLTWEKCHFMVTRIILGHKIPARALKLIRQIYPLLKICHHQFL